MARSIAETTMNENSPMLITPVFIDENIIVITVVIKIDF